MFEESTKIPTCLNPDYMVISYQKNIIQKKYVTSLKSVIKINFILFYDIFLSMDQFNSHQDAFMEINNSAVL